ncbi:MAG: helix-turn-helix domain-containing protein, partial [Chitinivibrionales bacterium]|nr:helix-turn-helix domain-containing protein [Chitinivibrionales bacterium]
MDNDAIYMRNTAMPRNPRVQRRLERFRGVNYEYARIDPPVKIIGSVLSRWGPGDKFERARRDNVSLSLVTVGSARYRQQGREGDILTGEVFIAHRPGGQLFETGGAGILHKRSLMFDGRELDAVIASLGLSEHDRIKPHAPRRMISLFRDANRLFRAGPPSLGIELSTIAWEILLRCAESITTDLPPALTRAVEYTRRNIHLPLRVVDICRAAGISQRHCTRLYQRHLGCSPIAFYLQQKMAVAESMVANTTLSSTQIAAALGYEDPLYFSAQFKKFHNLSPSHYRRRHAED